MSKAQDAADTAEEEHRPDPEVLKRIRDREDVPGDWVIDRYLDSLEDSA